MVGQLTVKQRLDDLLTDLPHEGVKIIQWFDALLLKQLFQFVSVESQCNLLDLFYLFKEVYTVFLTLPLRARFSRLLTSPSGRGYSPTMNWGANSMPGGGIQLDRKKQILILYQLYIIWL
jgi:hypothetical protein